MIHGLHNHYLYSAKKIISTWSDGTNTVELRGTGFILRKNDDFILVTNRHVVEPVYYAAKYAGYKVTCFQIESFESFDASGLPQNMNSASISNWSDFVFHPNQYNDIACLKNPKTIGGDFTINAPIEISMLATAEWINQKLVVCDTIAYPGFPEWYDRLNNTPIFRMGTIASDPRLNYSYNPSAPVSDRIAYEGFSTGGASGSPVFAIQRGFRTGKGLTASDDFFREVKIIGINAGHYPDQATHSGISYLYKSSAILDITDTM